MSQELSDNITALLAAHAPSALPADPNLIAGQILSGSEMDHAAEHATGLPRANSVGVAVIGPSEPFHAQFVRPLALSLYVVRQIHTYPPLDQVPLISRLGNSIYIVDLDSDPEIALKVVEGLSRDRDAVVLVASSYFTTDLAVRVMRAGAREILPLPLTRDELDQAMARAHSRVSDAAPGSLGRLCVFLGAKGGAGTTTVASNFALAAALSSQKRVLLIDFDLPLGDAVLNFGMKPEFSTQDALFSSNRLDVTLLTHYALRHQSGLCLLPAQGKCDRCELTKEAVDKLILVARQGFDCVVLDAATRFDLAHTAIFHRDAQIYLVSQSNIADLRNSNRILSQFVSGTESRNVQVVLNRDASFDEDLITRVLTQPVRWRIPNDFKAVREMQKTGVPIAMSDSPITRTVRNMACAALELSPEPGRKRKSILGLF